MPGWGGRLTRPSTRGLRPWRHAWSWRAQPNRRHAAPRCSAGSPRRGSAVVLAVEVADAPGQVGEELVRQGRHVVEDGQEVALVEHEDVHLAVGRDRGGAGPVVEEGQLT